ncbi:MAG: Z1 domain-containing protein [Romboutsia sp.]
MHNSKDLLYNLLITTIVTNNIDTEEAIDFTIENLKTMIRISSQISDEEANQVRNRVMSERSIKIELGTLLQGDYKYEKWFLNKKSELDMKYWERYKKYLIQQQNFAPNVVNTMDDMLDTLTDLLGNPNIDGDFQRRGLIVGDVQSGKTSNYTGLICKAADAGYKAIVLLTGTIEKLRKQTQLRIDEGFVGRDSAAMIKHNDKSLIGVGNFDPSIYPMVLTSTINDFKIQTARSLIFDLNTINQPIIFVMKKNVSSLRNLNKWLRTFNQNDEENINQSLLLVDDESDNASINTNPEDRSPTSINKEIRDLLNLFSKSSYVGFTATPFANIFIDPDTDDSMLKEDLFPKDYIYSLNAPSNYIGARDIFSPDGEHQDMLVNIDEEAMSECLSLTHKSDYYVDYIPNDLKEAICTFLIANTIRDLRKDINTHRSMLINVSRFTSIQEQISTLVLSYLKEIQESVKVYSKLDRKDALKDKYISYLYESYNKHYADTEFTWDEIQNSLHKSIAPVTTAIVNQRSQNKLNYEEHSSVGLRVIAIGGLSLSRGLTLEGLIVSYLYRNSKMYDTLMQMGRWFGYRKNYEDLCKIWMTEESIEWYSHISEATDELRLEIKKYESSELTPKDFGLRVRSDINTLLVTARNKMRTASSQEVSVSLSGEVVETPSLYADINKNIINRNIVYKLIDAIKKDGITPVKQNKNNICYKKVQKSHIVNLLNTIDVSVANVLFDTNCIVSFLENYNGKELEKWDVAFVSGNSNREFTIDEENSISLIERSFSIENGNKILKMSGSKNRIGSSSNGELGLEKNEINKVKNMYEIYKGEKKYNIPQKYYFRSINRNPLLVIYMVDLKDCKKSSLDVADEIKEKFINQDIPLVGFSIGIPELSNHETKYIRYTTNRIHQILNNDDLYDIGDDE